jgi:hypothetical protein
MSTTVAARASTRMKVMVITPGPSAPMVVQLLPMREPSVANGAC